MRFIRLALATALLPLFAAACSPPQNGTQDGKVQQAERGDAYAQYTLGTAYRDGKDLPQDYAKAVYWYRKAAEQGYEYAQDALGDAYKRGDGVPQDYAQAVDWYRKAAEQGNVFAQKSLSDAYWSGEGVSQDYVQSVYWRGKAAEQGNADAQSFLSYLFEEGKVVPQDFVLAYAWRNLAVTSSQENIVGVRSWKEADVYDSNRATALTLAESDLESNKSRRDSLAKKLTPPQLAEAQRLSSNWQKGQSIQRDKQ